MFKSKIKKYILSENSGEVMLESTIIFLIIAFVLVAMISLGFLYYQKAMISNVAVEIASDVASAYKPTSLTPTDGNAQNAATTIKMYRLSFALNSLKVLHKQRAQKYLDSRIPITTLGLTEGTPTVTQCDIIVDNIGRLHTEVTVEMKSDVLFSGALKYFGIIKEVPTFRATARAECLDVTGYAGYVHFAEYINNKASNSNTLNSAATIYGDARTSYSNIVETIGKIKDICNKING